MMPPFDLVRSILYRAHVLNQCHYDSSEALPESGPPIPGSRPPDAYDPVVCQYQDASPSYNPPAPWFVGVPIAGTPSQPPTAQVEAEISHDQIQYDDAAMDQQFHDELMQVALDGLAARDAPAAVPDNLGPDALPDPYSVPEPVQPEPDPVAFVNAVFDYHMQTMSAMPEAPAPEQIGPSMPLEHIVEYELQQMMDPACMGAPPDMMMAPDMPMDPSGPMPPGPGPM